MLIQRVGGDMKITISSDYEGLSEDDFNFVKNYNPELLRESLLSSITFTSTKDLVSLLDKQNNYSSYMNIGDLKKAVDLMYEEYIEGENG